MKNIKIVLYTLIFLFLLVLSLIKLPYFLQLSNELTDADNIIIEGWIRPAGLENLDFSKKQQTFVIGPVDSSQTKLSKIFNSYNDEGNFIRIERPGFFMPHPEAIIFKPGISQKNDTLNIIATAEITDSYFPSLVILLNDKVIGSHIINQEVTFIKQSINFSDSINNYLALLFINDDLTKNGDRNISIHEIFFSKSLNTFKDTRYVTFKKKEGECFHPGFESEAHLKTFYLRNLNMYTDVSIVPVPYIKVDYNKTHHSAKAFHNYLKTTHFPIKSANVISFGIHSRRSRMLYKRELKPISIGVISLPDNNFEYHWWKDKYSRHKVIDETLSYVYTFLFSY